MSVLCPPLDAITTTTTPVTTTTEIIDDKCSCVEEIEGFHELNRALGLQVGSLQVSSTEQNRRILQLSDEIQLQTRDIDQQNLKINQHNLEIDKLS